uniref:Carbohydratebinding protein putative n=1 Tax=Albugo laibachii Nc14 TaxID=890382 RepID=F0WMT4_9STRA|nr:carbohydratebinding protein putative [Albugo laibachii Nc14]|eukprot:CCA22619.1 carbohydratebinding protein putative [Albugo laibachii Nc14]
MSFTFGTSSNPAQGSTSTSAPTGGFNFGSSASTAPSSGASTFQFGSNSAATASNPAPTSTPFSFGSSTPQTNSNSNIVPGSGQSGFSFGTQSTGAPATSTAGFTFGNSSNEAAKSQGTSFQFGTTPASSLNSGSTTTPTFTFNTGSTSTSKPSIFGQPSPSTPFAGSFSTFGASSNPDNATPSNPSNTPIILNADPAVSQLNIIKAAYQDNSQSRFKFLMYNTIDPIQRHLYARPLFISERLWNQAEMDNPDPIHLAPAPIIGFQDLLKRIKAQQDHAGKYNQHITDLTTQVEFMEKKSRATEEKLEICRREHVKLFHKLLKVMKDLEFLQNLGKPLQQEEAELHVAFQKLQAVLDAPAQYKARVEEIVALRNLHKQQTKMKESPATSISLSPDDLNKVYQFLDKQRQGLEHLTAILNDGFADLKIMKDMWRR